MRLAEMVRSDMLGYEQESSKGLEEHFDLQTYELEPEDVEAAMEALSYLILHVAKTNAVDNESFDAVFETSALDMKFRDPLFKVCSSCAGELRQMLQRENERGGVHFKEMEWRLNLVTACRQRQKMMFPKYTVKIDLEQQPDKHMVNAKPTN